MTSVYNVMQWSIDNVCFWLQEVGFQQQTQTFRDHDIDGKALTLLNDGDIRELVTCIGPRVKFREALHLLLNPRLNHRQQAGNRGPTNFPATAHNKQHRCPHQHHHIQHPTQNKPHNQQPMICLDQTRYPANNLALNNHALNNNHTLNQTVNNNLINKDTLNNNTLNTTAGKPTVKTEQPADDNNKKATEQTCTQLNNVIDIDQLSGKENAKISQPLNDKLNTIEMVSKRLALRERSKIFRRSEKKWHIAVNETAYRMVLENPQLLQNKKELRLLAEADVRKTYKFVKGKSRSIVLPENRQLAEIRKQQKESKEKLQTLKRQLNVESDDLSRRMRQIHVAMTASIGDEVATSQLLEEMNVLSESQARIQRQMVEIMRSESALSQPVKRSQVFQNNNNNGEDFQHEDTYQALVLDNSPSFCNDLQHASAIQVDSQGSVVQKYDALRENYAPNNYDNQNNHDDEMNAVDYLSETGSEDDGDKFVVMDDGDNNASNDSADKQYLFKDVIVKQELENDFENSG